MENIFNWKRKKAAIYTRVSTSLQAEKGTGLDVQLDVCRKMCTIKNYEIVGEFIDSGVSGTVPAQKRKHFSQFFEEAKTGKFEVLVFYCFDRLARDMRVFLSIIDELRLLKIKIVSCGESVDTTTDAGDFMMNIYANVSNLELKTIRKRLLSGKMQKIMMTGYAGGRIPYGYKAINKIVQIDPDKAQVVKMIFKAYDKRISLNRIAEMLNRDGIAPPRKGKKWYAKGVSVIINNENKYKGCNMNDNKHDIRWPKII